MRMGLFLLLSACSNEKKSTSDGNPADNTSGEIVPTGVVREYAMTASYGTYELKMDGGMVMGELAGYLLDGQFLGPTLVANVGDTLRVTLHNGTNEEMGLHPHGVLYDPDNDGVSRVAGPGESVTYEWEAVQGTGTFLYHSHEMDADMAEYQGMAGILGVLVIRDPDEEEAAGTTNMLNYVLMNTYEPWTSIDEDAMEGMGGEGDSGEHHGEEGDTAEDPDTGEAEEEHEEEAHNHTLVVQSVTPDGNGGWTTDTLESLTALQEVDDTVRFNVVGFGEQFHTFHTHGYAWNDPYTGQLLDTVVVGPATSYWFRLTLDNPGLWMVHCHVDSHLHMMMSYLYVQE